MLSPATIVKVRIVMSAPEREEAAIGLKLLKISGSITLIIISPVMVSVMKALNPIFYRQEEGDQQKRVQ